MYTLLAYIYPNFIYTEIFWKIVKKHFEENPGNPYLCVRSSLFKPYWRKNGLSIVKLAKEFQENNESVSTIIVGPTKGYGIMFWTNNYKMDEQVRLLFIEWCINKYSK